MPFRLQSKNLFLTYPQCDEDPQALIDALLVTLETRNPTYIVVCRETHEDGNLHLHALVCLTNKLDTNNSAYLDFNGYHGNYQGAKSVPASYKYVIKDGDIVEWGVCPVGIKKKRKQVFAEAFAAPSKKAAQEILKSQAPDTYATCHNNIEAALNAHFKPDSSSYTPSRTYNDFILPESISDWFTTHYMVCLTLAHANPLFSNRVCL